LVIGLSADSLVLVAFAWSWLDPVAALLVAAGMVVVGRSVFRESRRLPPSES
jgi:divalent metal cation (Fe/Co/Zn/Cd) transporter